MIQVAGWNRKELGAEGEEYKIIFLLLLKKEDTGEPPQTEAGNPSTPAVWNMSSGYTPRSSNTRLYDPRRKASTIGRSLESSYSSASLCPIAVQLRTDRLRRHHPEKPTYQRAKKEMRRESAFPVPPPPSEELSPAALMK
ncbi:unnamed protein product [Nezara viridula]|uniref:Uncharacterized protein n=1 Tax=Nezara viridula TaxID=85310 RepID=A0A9P0HHY1_NEZVI|nr:unnamed protein product [Nezara viridula]